MHAIVNLNKPPGITSQQAVTRVRRLLGAKKAGHAGTLDPEATGVLLVCLNEATKISRFLLPLDKHYKARVKLGERTDTYDAWGTVIEKKDISFLDESHLAAVVQEFKGMIRQKPPMYSAVKIGGETLYKLARKGIEIDRPERTVHIYDLAITSVDLPWFEITISCSKGTYIRSLCDDIGMRLGTGAHMTALERTAVGFFEIKNAVSFDDLASGKGQLYSIDQALERLPEIVLDESMYQKARNGVKISSESFGIYDGEFLRMKDPTGRLFAIGRAGSNVISVERGLRLG